MFKGLRGIVWIIQATMRAPQTRFCNVWILHESSKSFVFWWFCALEMGSDMYIKIKKHGWVTFRLIICLVLYIISRKSFKTLQGIVTLLLFLLYRFQKKTNTTEGWKGKLRSRCRTWTYIQLSIVLSSRANGVNREEAQCQ